MAFEVYSSGLGAGKVDSLEEHLAKRFRASLSTSAA